MRSRVFLAMSAAALVLIALVVLQFVSSSRDAQPPESRSAMVSSSPALSVAEVSAPPPAMTPGRGGAGPTGVGTQPIAAALPQIAYTYTLGFRLPVGAIAGVQEVHLALCKRLGPQRCQLVAMQHTTNDEGPMTATLRLRIASQLAADMPRALGQAVTAAGGRAADTSVTADDVSKDIVDTDARIRQREILVARLTDMLRNRQGRVGELVEAERSVAQAQEELDQAKGWVAELRGRVAFSQFTITYVPVTASAPTPRSFSWSLSDAAAQSGAAFLTTVRVSLAVLVFLLPWLVVAGMVALLVRRWHRRRHYREAEG